MRVLREAVRYAYAPFMMFGLTGAAYWVVANGHSYFWLAPLLAIAYATAFAAERIAPFFEEWNDHAAHGDTPTNVLHVMAYEMSSINGVLLIPVICWLFPFHGLWPTQSPMWAQVLLAFVIADFAFMMMHYLSHRFAPLWRLHAVHHSDTEVDFTTTYRNHPLELYVNAPLTIPVILLLGFPAEVVAAYQLLKTSISVFAHSNVRLPAGLDRALRFVVITPDFHRLHHCSEKLYTDSNFSAAFPIYDYLFGTAKSRPYHEQETMQLGLEYFRDPVDGRLDRLLLMPFVWRSREQTRTSARPIPAELGVERRDKPRSACAVVGEGEL